MKSGFTLVEMLVVIAIIAILTAASTAAYRGVRQQGWRTRDRATAQQISQAWSVYLQEERAFPTKGFAKKDSYEATEANLSPIAPYEEYTDADGLRTWRIMSNRSCYLEISADELNRGRKINKSGGLFDHWKQYFMFSLDWDYDGEVDHPNKKLTEESKKTKKSSCIAWGYCGTSNPNRWVICW